MTRKPSEVVIVDFDIPMIVNGHQIPSNIKYEKTLMSVNSFYERYLVPGRLELSPCYQRDSVWSQKQEQAFVQSMFNAMAIPPFYLSRKPGSRMGFWVALDCRQRATAVVHFMQGKFKIRVIVKYSDGTSKSHKLSWIDIAENDLYVELRDRFLNRQIELVQFGLMDYDEQRKIFVALNNGTPLNADENNYCPNYLARRALDEIFNIVFKSTEVLNYEYDPEVTDGTCPGPGLASQVQTGVRCKKRFAHLRVIHECLILTLGIAKGEDTFTVGEAAPRSCKRLDRKESAEAIHEAMKAHGFDYDDSTTQEIIDFLGIGEQVNLLRDVADQLAFVLDANPTLGRKPNSKGEYDRYCLPRQIIDALCFLYTVIDQKHWTLGKLKGMRSRLAKWLAKYYTMKNEIGDYNMATSDALTMTGKYRMMRLSFNKMFGEDVPEWDAEKDIPNDRKNAIDKWIEDNKLRRIP